MLIVLLMTVVVHPSTEIIAVLIGIVLPLLTGLATKLKATSAVKVIVNAVLIAITGIFTTLASEPEAGLPLYDTFYAIALAAASSWGTYARIWKPLGVTDYIQRQTSEIGIGSSS